MGVKGLWKLLEPAARPVSSLDALRGQVVAIDISMWAHRLLKGGAGSHERALMLTFSRISKLLYYGIRCVIILDGTPPRIKLETQRRRRIRREAASERVERLRKQLLNQVVEMQAAVATSTSGDDGAVVDRVLQKLRDARKVESENDMFKLTEEISALEEIISSREESEEEIEQEDKKVGVKVEINLNDDDDDALIESVYFRELPPEVRHDMLLEMKAKRKYAASIAQASGSSLMPEDSTDFSAFQIKKALAGSRIAGKLREARNEITANAMERAGADASLLRRVMFSGGTDRAAGATEIRVETGGASASSEYVFVRPRRQYQNIQSIASLSTIKENPLMDPVKVEAFSQSQASHISAPSSHFMKIGVFDGATYAKGTTGKPKTSPSVSKFGLVGANPNEDEDNDSDDEYFKMIKPSLGQNGKPKLEPIQHSKNGDYVSDESDEFEEIPVARVVSSVKPKAEPIEHSPPRNLDGESESEECDDFEDVHGGPRVPSPVKPNAEPLEPESSDSVLRLEASSPSESGQSDDFQDIPAIPEQAERIKEVVQSPTSEKLSAAVENRFETVESSSPSRDIPQAELINDQAASNWQLEADFAAIREDRRESAQAALSEFEREKRVTAAPEQSFYSDVVELCRAFGFPVVESPGEAEAQAAALDAAGLINCCLTDDSDYWLFGGKRVLRGVFGRAVSSPKKNKPFDEEMAGAACVVYEIEDITKATGLDREMMVCIALIAGSDYSDGLRNFGPSLALDIWREFLPDETESEDDKILHPLRRFKESVLASVAGEKLQLNKSAQQLIERFIKRRKQANKKKAGQQVLDLEDISDERFPSAEAVEAFLRPNVKITQFLEKDPDDFMAIDERRTPLRWQQPDLERLKVFAKKQWNWQHDRTEAVLAPILRRIEITTANLPGQSTLTSLWNAIPTISKTKRHNSKQTEFPSKKKQKRN